MNAKEAVAKRILELCKIKGFTINSLANECGIPPTTIYSVLDMKSQNPGIVTIHKICNGLEISLFNFFNSPLFQNLEQEIK